MGARAGLDLIRPVNCVMIGFAVVVGAYVSKPVSISTLELALGFLTGFFICAYSMAVNDIYDIEVDRVNTPDRPLPSGRLSLSGASRISIVALLAGVACSVLTLNPLAVAIALLYAFLSWLYNGHAKKAGIPGNLIVASSLAIPFIYGGVVTGGSSTGSLLLLMALTSFFSGVGREVVKTMSDVEGDAKRGVRSVARTGGPRVAAGVGAAFFLLAVVTSWVPLVTGIANAIYTYGVIVPDAIFIGLAGAILARPDAKRALRVKRVALAGMMAGLLVFIGGAL
jgi:geranylgeranylglycerol-phosphate geranylgeranyltransferase